MKERMAMVIKNVKIYTKNQCFVPGSVVVEDGEIREVILEEEASGGDCAKERRKQEFSCGPKRGEKDDEAEWDGRGCYCMPGMIDLHFHGGVGHDFCDGTEEAIHEIAFYELRQGVTSIAPATMTLPVEELRQILRVAAGYRKEQKRRVENGTLDEAELVGINMEGPFISPAKKGAQDARYILPCDSELFRVFQEEADGLVSFIGIAPEEGEKEEVRRFIEEVKSSVTVSLAHTNADYENAFGAFQAGAGHLVHMYNAMPPFLHREPGVIGAAADAPHVMAEIICDGIHVHPAAVRGAFRMLGKDRMIFISDSMRAAGMKDGRYTLGGQEVDVKGNRAVMVSDGALAGSVTTLPDCVRIAVRKMGIPLETAVACATVNPARSLGIDGEFGSIEVGKKADLIFWDENLALRQVMKRGIMVR